MIYIYMIYIYIYVVLKLLTPYAHQSRGVFNSAHVAFTIPVSQGGASVQMDTDIHPPKRTSNKESIKICE